MKRSIFSFVVAALLLASVCASARGAMPLPPGTQVERDIAYGPEAEQRLDVYRPPQADSAPVIFMVHGGGWTRGDKGFASVVRNKAKFWIPKGYLLISTNYRLSPEIGALEEANDVARALAFAQRRAARWGGDPARFVLMGHSAGAHLVALLTADPGIATRQGARPWLGTVALDGAAYNVVAVMASRHARLYDRAFGKDRKLWREASPALRLNDAPVPMLLVCSSRRRKSCRQARAFAARATSLGGRATVLPIDMGHRAINEQLGTRGGYTSEVESFLRSLGLK